MMTEMLMDEEMAATEVRPLRELVLESDRAIRQAWGKLSKRSMEIGYEGAFLKRNDAWHLLGAIDEKAYRAAVGVGRSTWYKMVGLAERFPHLTKAEFMAMSIENAEQLAAAPMETRKDAELLDAATQMTARDFEGELVRHTAKRENKPVGEVYVNMKWRIKQAQREVIERGLADWQHEHGIDDEGYALELMIAEFRERPTLVGFMSESITRLTREVLDAKSTDDFERLRQTFAQHIREMGEILKICCGESRN